MLLKVRANFRQSLGPFKHRNKRLPWCGKVLEHILRLPALFTVWLKVCGAI